MQWFFLLCASLYAAGAGAEAPLADPMRPPLGVAPAPGNGSRAGSTAAGYELSAIFITQGRRSATINGRRVTEGEHIGAARVIAISATAVQLLLDGRRRTLTLLPLSIKKPVETLPR